MDKRDAENEYWTFPPALRLFTAFMAGFGVAAILLLALHLTGIVPFAGVIEQPRCDFISSPHSAETEATDFYRQHAMESAAQCQLYDDIEGALRIMAEGIVLDEPMTSREVHAAYRAVLDDNPDIFWAKSDYAMTENLSGIYMLKFEYLYEPEEAAALTLVHEEKCREAIELMSLYDGVPDNQHWTLELVHDWVVSNVEYVESVHDQTVAGVLDDGQAVCAGYSRTVKYLCDMMGIPCIYVHGHIYGDFSKPHAWNMAIADGELLYLDSTWDDQKAGDASWAEHSWFTSDAEKFEKSHWTGYTGGYEEEFGKELPGSNGGGTSDANYSLSELSNDA